MPDTKITALTALTAADPANDVLPIVDVSDTTMAASGTTKKISINNVLGCSGTATLASATISGAATVGTTLGVTGVSTFAAGTALLPAITTIGDTNTGIYYPAADTFAVTTGGSERLRIDSTGNVGIGVSPSYNLDVRAAAATANVQSSTGTNAVSIVARNTGGSFTLGKENSVGGGSGVFGQDAYASVLWSTGAYPIAFGTNGSQRVVVKSTGQVKFTPLSADPSGAEAGDVYYNSTSNKLKCYNGTTWNDLF